MYQYAVVRREWLEMHLYNVDLSKHQQSQIHAVHLHVDRTANAERSTVKPCVHAFQDSSVVHQLADQNASSVLNVRKIMPVIIKNAEILVLEHVVLEHGAQL